MEINLINLKNHNREEDKYEVNIGLGAMWLEVAKVVTVMWKAEDGSSALTESGTQQVLLKFIAITIMMSVRSTHISGPRQE